MTTGEKIRKIYHTFTTGDPDLHMRVYSEMPDYRLDITEIKGGYVRYNFIPYQRKIIDDSYTLPIESLDKIDLSELRMPLRLQLMQMEICYKDAEKYRMNPSNSIEEYQIQVFS